MGCDLSLIHIFTGFVLNETVYDVNISENEQVVEIEIVNELVRGNIALTKVDAEYTDTKMCIRDSLITAISPNSIYLRKTHHSKTQEVCPMM